jgi:hypothetical protein
MAVAVAMTAARRRQWRLIAPRNAQICVRGCRGTPS